MAFHKGAKLYMLGQMLRFGVVGTIGFLVDWGVLEAMLALGLGPYKGRVISYLAAASATFALNRAWTFAGRRGESSGEAALGWQWGRFLGVNLIGFTANFGTYAVTVANLTLVVENPVLGVVLGSLAGMFLNFWLSRRFVFGAR